MEKLATVLQSYMETHSVNELCNVFISKTSTRKGQNRLPLTKQDEFIQTVYELSDMLHELDAIMKQLDQDGLKVTIEESLEQYVSEMWKRLRVEFMMRW